MAEEKVAVAMSSATMLLPASLSGLTEDAAHCGKENAEEGTTSNFFASLMPNLFSRLQRCNEAVDEQEFQQITRLLDSARSEVDMIQGNPFFGQTCNPKAQEETRIMEALSQDGEKETEGLETKKSMLIRSENAVGKENVSWNNPPQRNKLLRRERSSRVATHRKPFAVDIRSFGSVLNSNELGKSEKPQDVHAFWEAADERDAAEAIMEKLKGRCGQIAGSETRHLRRLGVRRKNSQRTTTRLKRFAVELPLCAEQDQQLDEERLEEEDDTTQESSFTFVSNLGFRALNQAFQQEDAMKQVQRSQLSISPDPKAMDGIVLDEVSHPLDEDVDILSDGKSPTVTSHLKGEVPECSRHSETLVEMLDAAQKIRPTNLEISPAACDPKKGEVEKSDSASLSEMTETPCNRTTALKTTPFTSPTPPSNPLAAFKLRKDTAVEDMSKRRLEFDDSMGLPGPDLDLPAPVIQNALLQSLSTSSAPPNVSVLEETLESPEAFIPEALAPVEATEHMEPIAMKPLKRATKIKKPIDNRRNSLEDAGMIWEDKQRRSTRIKSRPLEWWRGERFLFGRVHKSLTTVIGIKYLSSPPTCLPKRGTKALNFKVKSYVSEEYAKYVEFAALG